MTIQPAKRRFNPVLVMEATAAAVLAALLISTFGGVAWLVIRLPNNLQQLEKDIAKFLKNQENLETRFSGLDEKVESLDRRIVRLEVD
jgi:hypothetical protein